MEMGQQAQVKELKPLTGKDINMYLHKDDNGK